MYIYRPTSGVVEVGVADDEPVHSDIGSCSSWVNPMYN